MVLVKGGEISASDIALAISGDKQIQFNDAGILSGDPKLTWNKTTTQVVLSGVAVLSGCVSTVVTGTQPYVCTSTTLNTNLNANFLQGKETGTSGNVIPLLDGTNTWSGAQTFGTKPINLSAISVIPTPTEGDIYNDDNAKSLYSYIGGIIRSFQGAIFAQTNSVTVTSSGIAIVTGTLLGTGVGTLTLPANFLTAGKTIRVTLYGVFTIGASAPTATFKAYFGSTTLCSSAAITPAKSITNQGWKAEFDITCRTAGSSGTVFSQGLVSIAISTADGQLVFMPTSSTVTINTTTTQIIDFKLAWGQVAGASMVSTNVSVEALN